MLRRGCAYIASLLLVIYVSVVFAADVVSLTCSCSHHKADCHTAFRHTHECSHHHTECCGVTLSEKSCCDHNHSTQIELYTQFRAIDDTLQNRLCLILSQITDSYAYSCESQQTGSYLYREFVLPYISEIFSTGTSLRAPPVLV